MLSHRERAETGAGDTAQHEWIGPTLERVAKALCCANRGTPIDLDAFCTDYMDEARIAIAAMREPTEAMVDRGDEAHANCGSVGDDGWEPNNYPAWICWTTMIDEALK